VRAQRPQRIRLARGVAIRVRDERVVTRRLEQLLGALQRAREEPDRDVRHHDPDAHRAPAAQRPGEPVGLEPEPFHGGPHALAGGWADIRRARHCTRGRGPRNSSGSSDVGERRTSLRSRKIGHGGQP
jgi:hypothetical protein